MGIFGRILALFGIRRSAESVIQEIAGLPRQGEPMPEPEETCRVIPLSEEIVRFACGHDAPARFAVIFWGEPKEPTDEVLAARKECGECVLALWRPKLIRCARCGFPIGPGDPVALYEDDGRFKPERKTAVERDGRRRVIGCLRWDCCPSGAFFVGNWDGEKVRYRFHEGTSAAEYAFRTGEAVYVASTDDED